MRLRAIANEILKCSFPVDIVGLQEVWMQEDYEFLAKTLSSILPFSTYFYSGSIGSGLATFSRWPIEQIEFRRYSTTGRPEHIFRGDWFAGKGIGLARILHPSGTPINLLNTHVCHLLGA